VHKHVNARGIIIKPFSLRITSRCSTHYGVIISINITSVSEDRQSLDGRLYTSTVSSLVRQSSCQVNIRTVRSPNLGAATVSQPMSNVSPSTLATNEQCTDRKATPNHNHFNRPNWKYVTHTPRSSQASKATGILFCSVGRMMAHIEPS
jgi:hypothetical protein